MKNLLNHFTTVFSVVLLCMIFIILIPVNLLLQQVMNLLKKSVQLLKIHRLKLLKSVQYLPANRNKVFVQDVMDVTLQPDVWFRKVKLLVLLLHSPSVSLVHSLHFVHSTWGVLPVLTLHLLHVLLQNMTVLLKLMNYVQLNIQTMKDVTMRLY